MQRIHQGAALCFTVFSAFVVWEAWNLEYYTPLGPGAGYFPLWLGILMGGLSLAWLIQISGRKGTQAKPEGYTIVNTNFPSSIISYLDPARKATYTRDLHPQEL